ncbi:MAG: SUMF1/EgtB/PvdO family nonheme iron enzyme [Gammaproteobacteria bacterium]|nr:SUMF1/EgtB/PvdO family nonheme iron enzyme [Gammaproteobacteria bacterium]
MGKIIQTAQGLLLLLLIATNTAWAEEKRLALVIGNSDYTNAPLVNPINDAQDMASTLEGLGFDVILETNADRRSMGRAIRTFGKRLKQDKGVGLFYYAGHGVQVDNRNFLIPVDAPVEEADEIPYESVDVGSVLAKMESAGNSLNVLILDACRNNPFPSDTRTASRGLARVEAPVGSLVVYSTAPGKVAEDGEGRNGTFTSHLLKFLQEPNLTLTQTVRKTRAAVVKQTEGRQVPWASSSLLTDYYLNPQENKSSSTSKFQAADVEVLFWQSAEKGNTSEDYLAYLQAFPEGQFSTLAESRMARLTSQPSLDTKDLGSLTTSDTHEDTNVLAMVESGDQTAVQDPRPSPGEVETRGKFYVDAQPSEARVRIMNIVDKYFPGIQLDYGKRYDVYVTHPGYKPWRQTIVFNADTEYLQVFMESDKTPSADKPRFVTVSGDVYRMGCSEGDSRCKQSEKPSRDVNVATFRISTTEITVGQFKKFVSATNYKTDAEQNAGGFKGCYIWTERKGISRSNGTWQWSTEHNWRDPGYPQTDEFPVTCVSWNDARAYAKWLSRTSGKAYRLPTEAEWEYAARGGTQSMFSFGNSVSDTCSYANGADRTVSPAGSKWSSRMKCSDGQWFSAPVATYRPNPFGLFDMHGNVWEWVVDNWAETLKAHPTDGGAYADGESDKKVLRGGAWDGASSALRASSRSRGIQASRAAMTGFRVVESLARN